MTGSRSHRSLAWFAGQDGATLVELMVVVMMVTVGLIAIVGALDQATRTATAAQRHQQAIQVGQREIERLKDIPYEDLGHAVLPTSASSGVPLGNPSPKNPNFYVSGSGASTRFKVKSNYRNMNSAPPPGVETSGEPMVHLPGNAQALPTQPESFTVGNTSGVVWRFVSWRAENCAHCTGHDSKRITVAVRLNTSPGTPVPNKPIWVTSVYANPSGTPPGVPAPGGPTVSSQPFFLYDTHCGPPTPEQRRALTGNHVTRNTSQVGATCTAAAGPNLMWRTAPPASQPLNDYSTDVAGSERTRLRGLGLQRFGDTCVVGYDGDTAENPNHVATWMPRVHSWATAPFASQFRTPDDGSDTALSVYVESSTGSAGQQGKLCLTLRRQDTGGGLSPIRTVVSDTRTWPSTANPQLMTFTFHHAAVVLAAGERLWLTVSVVDANGDVNVLYDHPDYPSVLTVETTTPLT